MSKLLTWIDDRFPLTALWKSQVSEYYAPKNFNFWYYFGSLALLVLVMQIVTGIFLTMSYKPDAARAFESGEIGSRIVALPVAVAANPSPGLRLGAGHDDRAAIEHAEYLSLIEERLNDIGKSEMALAAESGTASRRRRACPGGSSGRPG